MKRDLQRILLSKIIPPQKQAREAINHQALEELALSMKLLGQLQPILLRPMGEGLEIEAGHRRFLAAKFLDWTEIDAYILEPTDEDALHLERAHENLIREELNPVEQARQVWDIVYEDGRGVERAAALLCKTRNWIESRLEIWKYPEDLKDAVRKNLIKITAAKELAKVKDDETRKKLTDGAIEFGASVETIRRWISDATTSTYFETREVQQDGDGFASILQTEVVMPCRICNLSHKINVLRHIWICPECMSVVRELARETQRELAAAEVQKEQ